ncbi:MAG: enoyl-CoA hydratase-related protein [archaeon]|nr:enoyl-CoA hydratase-related protein [archaeon]
MNFKEVKYEVDAANHIAHLRLSRPDRMNAYTVTMAKEIVQCVDLANRDDLVRVVILSGDPEGKAFCAGADLSPHGFAELTSLDVESREKIGMSGSSAWRDPGGLAALALLRCRKVVIAAINGNAVGIGITLPLAADIRIVKSDARIGFVFCRRGIAPEACSTVLLQRIVSRSKALEWIITGRVFTAGEAKDTGLFNEVIEGDSAAVLARAVAMAKEIAAYVSPKSIAISKALLLSGLTSTLEQAHLDESRVLHHVFLGEDCQEGVMSFFERRPPKFEGSAWRDMPEAFPWDGSRQTINPFDAQSLITSKL